MSEDTNTPQQEQAAETAPAATAKPKKEKKAKEPKAEKAPKEVKVKPEPKAKDTKNGVTRPSTGVTLLVWTTADSLSKEKGAPVERAPLVEALKGKVEVGTIHTQYGRWRKYYGLTETKEQRQARLEEVRVKKNAAKAAEKAIKDAAKAEEKTAKDAEKAKKKADKEAAEAAKKAAAEQTAEQAQAQETA